MVPLLPHRITALTTQRGLQPSGIQQQRECIGGAGDEEIRVANRIDGAAFAIIHRNSQPAAACDSLEHQPIEVAIAKCDHGTKIELAHVGAFLPVVIAAGSCEVMDFKRQPGERLADRAESVRSEYIHVQLLGEGGEGRPHSCSETPPQRKCAGKIADKNSKVTAANAGDIHGDAGFIQGHGILAQPIVTQIHAARMRQRSCTLSRRTMTIAITRAVSPALANCELSFVERRPIDLARAREQHRAYELALESLGAHVVSLPAEPELPDSMFVEDPAIVLDELAVIFPLGTASRRAEAESLARVLAPYRKLERVELPATIEGGDVLRIGRELYVGLSRRTNSEGIRRLAAILSPYGYEVTSVPVNGCLHLKSAVTYLGRRKLLANREWFDAAPFAGYEWVDVAAEEPHAANALAVGDAVIFPAAFSSTRERIEKCGFRVIPLDISELQKAESGLTCSSLIFEG